MAAVSITGMGARAQSQAQTPNPGGAPVLRVVPHADLKILDPMVVSILITRMHGLMVYESLFAWDRSLAAKPMMVGDYEVGEGGRRYRFRLRDGQRFHDGTPVEAQDVVASLQRWMKRDLVGQKLAQYTSGLEARNAQTVELTLNRPYGFVEFSLGSAIGGGPMILRRQDAASDPTRPISTAVGSGPFRFVAEEWVTGSKVVYAKNMAYQPRSEPPDGLAGRREVLVNRVEWIIMPDSATAAASLQSGEIDYWDNVPSDLVPLIKNKQRITVGEVLNIPNVAMVRPNSLLPPFNHVKARQALALALDETEYMETVAGDNLPWKICDDFFVCGSANATIGDTVTPINKARARQLLAEAGYKGERVVLVSSPDIPAIAQLAQVTEQRLKEIGVNVDLQMYDWGTANTRILSQAPVEQGGWNLYCTNFSGAAQFSPLTNVAANTACDRSNWVGWPCDQPAAALRQAFLDASDDASRHDSLVQLQQRLAEVQPYRILGQYTPVAAWRNNLSTPQQACVPVFWNIGKH